MEHKQTAVPSATLEEMVEASRRIRGTVLELSHNARTPHLGSALSCVDIVVACYWGALALDPTDPADVGRDRFILSKGHAATTLYAALAHRGILPMVALESYALPGSHLVEHPVCRAVPGVEVTSGSLGHGLSLGLGMALAGRIQDRLYRVFVLMSDGECDEGSVWEAALFAPAHALDNVAVVIDYNKWQATDRSNEVMALAPLRQKWEAFGWSAQEVDGHDLGALVRALRNVPDGSGKPVAIVAHTVKGKGVSFMEDDNNWHYRIPNAGELERARAELKLTRSDAGAD
jgi:transketolase